MACSKTSNKCFSTLKSRLLNCLITRSNCRNLWLNNKYSSICSRRYTREMTNGSWLLIGDMKYIILKTSTQKISQAICLSLLPLRMNTQEWNISCSSWRKTLLLQMSRSISMVTKTICSWEFSLTTTAMSGKRCKLTRNHIKEISVSITLMKCSADARPYCTNNDLFTSLA